MNLRTALVLPFFLVLTAQEPSSTYKPADSVVKVVADSDCNSRLVGSGVVVAPGIIVTSAHGVQGCSEIRIHHGSGTTYGVSQHILAADLDLCLLRVPGLPSPSATICDEELAPLGSPITAIGFPNGKGPVVTTGKLTAYWQTSYGKLIQTNAEVHPGCSGGGVFAPDGRLISITSFVLGTYQDFNVSVPARLVLQLLQRPWQEGRCIALCKPKEIITQDFIDRMAIEPANNKAWEAFSRTWVAKSPGDANAWYSLGHTLSQRLAQNPGIDADGQMARAARTAYQRAIELNPTHPKSWNNLGALYLNLGQDEQALQALLHAVGVKEDYGLAWLNLGTTYLNLRNFKEACEAYKKGLQTLPDEAHQWASLAFCEGKADALDEAIHHIRIALRHQPTQIKWWKEFFAYSARTKRQQDFQLELSRLRARLPDLAARVQDEIQEP